MEQQTKEQATKLITKEMTIGDVVAKYPAVIEPLQEAGVHCVGCHVSYSVGIVPKSSIPKNQFLMPVTAVYLCRLKEYQ